MNKIDALLTTIANATLGVETLTPQGSDRLDFHEVSVEALRDALAAAYNAGIEQGRKAGNADASGG